MHHDRQCADIQARKRSQATSTIACNHVLAYQVREDEYPPNMEPRRGSGSIMDRYLGHDHPILPDDRIAKATILIRRHRRTNYSGQLPEF